MMNTIWKYYKTSTPIGNLYRSDGVGLQRYLYAYISFSVFTSWWEVHLDNTIDIEINERELIEIPNEEAFLELL